MSKGSLFLIPTFLGDNLAEGSLVPVVKQVLLQLNEFIVENVKSSRKFLRETGLKVPQQDLIFLEYSKNHKLTMDEYFASLQAGKDVGLLSEAGCPAIADPGADIVREAHRRSITVKPFVGPSAIYLGLMASGFNGQSFAFHGYLPIVDKDKVWRIRSLENQSEKFDQTQLFIETPFRNVQLFIALLANCLPDTEVCVACGLTTPSEMIATKTISQWRNVPIPEIHKVPAIFLLYRRGK